MVFLEEYGKCTISLLFIISMILILGQSSKEVREWL
jgi:hypothetical protein